MMRLSVMAGLLAGCASSPSADPISLAAASAGPPVSVDLVAEPLILGVPNELRLTGFPVPHPSNVQLGLAYSVSQRSALWCPPYLGACTGLADPADFVSVQTLGPSDEASFTVTPPSEGALGALPPQISFQALAAYQGSLVATSDVETVPVVGSTAICDAVAALSIGSTQPTTEDDLVAQLDTFGSTLLWDYLVLTWRVDGSTVAADGLEIPAVDTSPGQTWEVEVTATLPDRTCTQSASVTVANRAPTCTSAVITPETPWSGESVTCSCAAYTDPDGDPADDPRCTWTDDTGAELGTSCTLDGDQVRAGTLTCALSPFDGIDEGPAVQASTSPRNAQATVDEVTLTPSATPVRGVDGTTVLTCAVQATDLESDPLTAQVRWMLNGVEVLTASTTTLSAGTTLADLSTASGRPIVRDDAIGCEATVSDGVSEQAAVTMSSPALVVANSAPTAAATVEDARGDAAFTCAAVSADHDGDPVELSYAWQSAATGSLSSSTATQSAAGLVRDDTVTCTVTASDGEDNAETTSAPATVLNRLPTVERVGEQRATIEPSVVVDALVCSGVGWSDGDGDPEGYVCEIAINGTVVESQTIAGGATMELTNAEASWDLGDVIVYRVTPWDGLELGTPVEHTQTVQFDSNEVCSAIAGLSLTPSSPTADRALTLELDLVASPGLWNLIDIDWRRDGQPTSYTGLVVPASATARGETWRATVTATLPDQTCNNTVTTTIVNSVPQCAAAVVSPDPLFANTDVTCLCDGYADADGDANQPRCTWRDAQGTLVGEDCTLQASAVRSGDALTCAVVPFDGIEEGASVEVTIDPNNAQPLLLDITLTPGTTPVRGTDDSTSFTCVVNALDLESDGIEMTARWLVNGQEVAAETTPSLSVSTTVGDLAAGLGRQLIRDDLVWCEATVSDAVSAATPPSAASSIYNIDNTPPEVLTVALADVRGDEIMVCEPTFYDADGDLPLLQTTYVWQSTELGTLPSIGRTLSTVGMSRDDQVTCSPRINDGFDVAEGTSNVATVLNRLPSFSSFAGTSSTTSNSASGQILRCSGSHWQDGDGDPEGLSCDIYINDVLVRSQTLANASAVSLSPAEFTWRAGDVIRWVLRPWDGLEFGETIEHIQTVRLSTPDFCREAEIVRSPEGDLSCVCNDFVGIDSDEDPSNDICRWWVERDYKSRLASREDSTTYITSPIMEGCEQPSAEVPATALRCEYFAYDGRDVPGGGQLGRPIVTEKIRPVVSPPRPTLAGPLNLQLLPANPTVTMDDDFLCSFDRPGFNPEAAIPAQYTVWWKVNGEFIYNFGDQLHPLSVGASPAGDPDWGWLQDGRIYVRRLYEWARGNQVLDRSTPQAGDTVQCIVTVRDGDQTAETFGGGPFLQASGIVTFQDALPGEVLTFVAAPSSGVQPSDTVSCEVAVEPGYAGSLVLEVEGDDGQGWTTLTSVMDTTDSLTLSYLVDDPSLQALRCRARIDDGGTSTDLEIGDDIPVFAAAPTVAARVTPASGDACVARTCDVTLSESGGPVGGLRYDMVVQWAVDGQPQGDPTSLSVTSASRGRGAERSVSPPLLQIGPGEDLSCIIDVTLVGTTDTVTVTSAPGSITGVIPGITTLSVPERVRNDSVVTCTPEGVSSNCATAPAIDYLWTQDGVEVGDEAELDTTGLPAGSPLVCTATPVDISGLAGPATVSAPVEVLPGRWTLFGAGAEDYAGMSVASIGDLTGDGLPDLAIGAPNAGDGVADGAGRLYVVPTEPTAEPVALADVDAGTLGWSWRGEGGGWDMYTTWCNTPLNTECETDAPGVADDGAFWAPLGEGLGTRVRAAGDLDGDAVPDLLVSAPYALGNGAYLAGRTYQISGAAIWDPAFNIAQLQRNGGRYLDGAQGVSRQDAYVEVVQDEAWRLNPLYDGHLSGFGLAAADLNGDGYRDAIIGALKAEGDLDVGTGVAPNAGGAWAVPGGPGQPDAWLGDLEAVGGAHWVGVDLDRSAFPWVPVSAEVGRHLANVGDMDGDGDDEVLVSHTGASGWNGGWWNSIYIVSGGEIRPLRFAQAEEGVRRLETPGAQFAQSWSVPYAIASGKTDWFGMASGAGDVNGDGLADLVVPFTEAEGSAKQAEIAVFFGSASTDDFDPDGPDAGLDGFVVEGSTLEGGYDMLHAAGLGDVDGDGLDDIGIGYRAFASSGPGKTRLAIIYGRAGTTRVTWGDLRAGLAGQVIDLDGSDFVSELTADDLDGDGLADVVVGRPYYDDPDVGDNIGRVDVWFGRDLRGSIDQFGTLGDDVLTGTADEDSLVGGRGADIIEGGGGLDVLYGGSGDDELSVADLDFRRVRGGEGHDTLVLDLSGAAALADVRGLVQGIEAIDLGRGAVDLTLRYPDVLRMPDLARTLAVHGGSDDTLVLPDVGWLDAGLAPSGEQLLTNGAATLVVDPDIPITAAPTLVLDALAVDENTPVDTAIGTIAAVELAGGVVDVSVQVPEGVRYDRVAAQLVVDGPLDHERTPYLTIDVRAEGSTGLVVTERLTVDIVDVAEAPRFVASTGRSSADELAAYDTTVAQVAAIDADAGELLTYRWVSEDHIGAAPGRKAFEVDASTGRVYVVNGAFLDFEAAPTVVLTLEVEDRSGLTDTRTLTVELRDRTAQEQVFVVPFVSEDHALMPPDEPIASLAPEPFNYSDSLDVSLPEIPVGGLAELLSEDTLLALDVTGTIDHETTVQVSLPTATTYLPVEVRFELPDGVEEGVPFVPDMGWLLTDDAAMQGTTTGIDFEFAYLIDNLSWTLTDAPSGTVLHDVSPINTGASLDVSMASEDFVGAKLSVIDPDGVFLADPELEPEDLFDGNAMFNHAMGAMLSTEYGAGVVFQDDDFIVAPGVSSKLLRVPTDPLIFLRDNGYPVLTPMWGSFTYPRIVGEHRFNYAVYEAPTYGVAQSHELYAVEVKAVSATFTFEGGTVVHYGDIRAPSLDPITLTPGEDVNGDGVASFVLDLDVDADVRRFWLLKVGLDMPTTGVLWSAQTWVYEFDAQGDRVGETLVRDDTFGPLIESEWNWDAAIDKSNERWRLEGAQTVSLPGGLQLAGYDPTANDDDGDGVADIDDQCPGEDDTRDGDVDGTPDCLDACPCDATDQCIDPLAAFDSDGDGLCNDVDPCPFGNDVDGDQVCDEVDNCVDVANPDQRDIGGVPTFAMDADGSPTEMLWLGPLAGSGGCSNMTVVPGIQTTTPVEGDTDSGFTWTRRSEPTGSWDIEDIFGQQENRVAYAVAYVVADAEIDAQVQWGSDDAAHFWLNGEEQAAVAECRGVDVNDELTPIRLQAGVNTLMWRVAQGNGGWGLEFRLQDLAGNPLQLDTTLADASDGVGDLCAVP